MNKETICPMPIAENVTRETDYDVVVIGGSFSGSSSAILLKRQFPDLNILIIEKATEFKRKVGESTSEVAGCFLVNVLKQGRYLANKHVAKHGLRMWFHKGDKDKAGDCSEIGPRFQARLPTYQLHRLELDEHLLDEAEELGCEVQRPASIVNLELGGIGQNVVIYKDANKDEISVTAGWVIDASGKAALIARQRNLYRKNTEDHPVNSMWTRFKNVCDLDSEEAVEAMSGMSDVVVSPRGAATNHLMGFGWWSWIIPLENGEFSLGVTWDERLYTPPADGSMADRVKAHVMTHPVGEILLKDAVAVEKDNNYYKGFSYYSERVFGEGWTIVGDAGGFMDPLYSQGLDFCSHTVYSSFGMLRDYYSGECVKQQIVQRAGEFKRSYFHWFNAIYRDKYWYIGDAELMYAAFLLDISTYFIGPVRLVYGDQEAEFSKMPYDGLVGSMFARFMKFYNRRLVTLAKKKISAGKYGDKNLKAEYLPCRSFSPDPSVMRLFAKGIGVWLKAEVRLIFASSKVSLSPSAATPLPERGDQQEAQQHGDEHSEATV